MYNTIKKEKYYLKNIRPNKFNKIIEFKDYNKLVLYIAYHYTYNSYGIDSWKYLSPKNEKMYKNAIIIKSFVNPSEADENVTDRFGLIVSSKIYYCYKEDGTIFNLRDKNFVQECYDYFQNHRLTIENEYYKYFGLHNIFDTHIYGEFRKDPVGRLVKNPNRTKLCRRVSIYHRPTNINFMEEDNWDINSIEKTWARRAISYKPYHSKKSWKNNRKHQWKEK